MISIQQHRWAIGSFRPRIITKLKNYNFCKYNSKNHLKALIIFWILLGPLGISGYSLYIKENLNKSNHIKNGNIQKARSNFRLLHWNKGNSSLDNKINDICSTIQDFNPDIFSISEANLKIGSTISFKDYKIEFNRLHTHSTQSRSIVLINNRIPYTRRYDLETPLISFIWLEVPINKNNKLLLCSYYR